MALSFRQHRNRIRLLTGNKLDDARCGDLLNMVLERLYGYSWSWRKKEALLVTVAPYSAGSVSLNSDPTKVDGSGTAWTSAFVGREFRAASDVGFYRITAVVGQQLTLETGYAGLAFTTASYSITQRLYSLAADVDVVPSLAYWRKLSESTIEGSDRFDARRTYTSDFPYAFVYKGIDAAGSVQIEIKPVPSAAIPIRYNYIARAPLLVPGTDDGVVVPMEADVLDLLTAAEGLDVWCAEHPEVPGVQTLLTLAERHRAKGMVALQEALFADLKRAGAANAIHDIDEAAYGDDDFAWSHDLGL
jgi:hypothetical protein